VNILGYNRYDDRPREMHDIKCSECGKDAQVPFKPDGERPVYCRECYQKQRRSRY
jgi:CxxC-x17-CxxC domain-containing protein